MTGAFSRRARAGTVLAIVAAASVFARVACAQAPVDQPSLPAATEPAPAVSTDPNNPPLPPYSPSNNAASPLLPASPPLPPRPSIPTLSLLPPDSTPPPLPPPLPVPEQTGSALSPTASGTVLTNGAPGTTPATEVPGGANFTNNTGAVRRFQYAFRLSTGVTYDDNLFLASDDAPSVSKGVASPRRGVSRSDTYFYIDPAISLGYGDFLTRATNYIEFDYNADVLLYTRNTNQDTVQHFATLQGAYHFAQVTLTLSQGVQILDSTEVGSGNNGSQLGGGASVGPSTQVNLDASQRTGLNVFSTRVGANYAFSPKSSVDLEGYFAAYDYASLISSDTLSGDVYFNYTPTGKITFGLGVTAGFTLQDAPAPDEAYQQLNLRLNYAATGKLSFGGTLGLEVRESGGDRRTVVNPVFDLTATYIPFDGTSLSLVANRSVQTSAVLTGADYNSTGFSFSVSQRFFQRVTTHLSLGYTHSDYQNAGSGSVPDRSDNFYFVQPGVEYLIRDNLSAGVSYTHRQNVPSVSGSGFSDNQISAHLSLSF